MLLGQSNYFLKVGDQLTYFDMMTPEKQTLNSYKWKLLDGVMSSYNFQILQKRGARFVLIIEWKQGIQNLT